MQDVLKEKENLRIAHDNQEHSENKDHFVEVFVENRKYFTHNSKSYFVQIPNRKVEKDIFRFKRSRIRYWIEQGMSTLSEMKKYCERNRDKFPQEFYILVKTTKKEEDGEEFTDFDPKGVSLKEYDMIQKMIEDGAGQNDILRALKYKPETHMLHIVAGQSEQLQLQETAEIMAGTEEDEFLISKVTFTVEGEKLVWGSIDEVQVDGSGLVDAALDAYEALLNEVDKKKSSI